MSAVSALAGPRRSKARIAARIASRPIWAPAPSSPSVKPRPPMMVSFPLTRAIAAEPVPAITSPPSTPAWAPMHAVTASFAARTRRKPGNASTTRAASLGVLDSGEPESDRDPRPVGARETGLVHDLADDRAQDGDCGGEIDMDICRRAACLDERVAVGVAQPRAAAGRRRRRRQG